MARGFESKMVEFNQEEAARGRNKAEPLSAEEQARLARRATLFGPLYGIGVYLVMNYVVLPLSAFPPTD